MYYTIENENYRKYGIVILEIYDEILRTTVYQYRKLTHSEQKEIILNYFYEQPHQNDVEISSTIERI